MMEGKKWLRKLRRTLGTPPPGPDPTWPVWYTEYWRETQKKPGKKQLLRETPIVVLDAETTGLNAETDRMLSLGGLQVIGNSINLGEKFEVYLPTPPGSASARAVAIHGIIPNSLRYEYTEEPKLLANLLAYLGNAIIVGHHIGFDLEIINRALARNGAGPIRNRVVDTAKLSMRLRPAGYWSPKDDYSLDTLARRYRIPLSDRHTALGDCYITSVLWLKLLTRLAVKLGRDLVLGDVLDRRG